MAKSLKDALLNVGLRSTKTENERSSTRGRVVKKAESHQQTRNYCEVCEGVNPDVERYKHRNPTIDAQWICVACADKNMIDDQFRVTQQSDFSKRGAFKRFYGATKVFEKVSSDNRGKGQSRGPKDRDGNRGHKKPHSKNRKNFKKDRNFNS